MKKKLLFSLLLSFLCIIIGGIFSASAESYGFSYTISNGKVTITDCSTTVTEVIIPDTIDGCPVTTIDEWAFSFCSNLTSITFGKNITYVGENAFYKCNNLTKVCVTDMSSWCNINFVSASNPLYYAQRLYLNGKIVNDLVIPENVTNIKPYVFYYCNSLKTVTFHNDMEKIGKSAFSGCDNLTSIDLSTGVQYVDESAFYHCSSLNSIVIGENVKSIGKTAFHYTSFYYDNTNWQNDVLYIDNCLIEAKSSATNNFTINDGTKLIASYALEKCTNVTSVFLPDSLKSISDYGLYNIKFTSINIPSNLESVGNYAFYGCSKLEGVYVDDITTWCNIKFSSSYSNPLYYASGLYVNNELQTNIEIPNGVPVIEDYTFYTYDNLETIVIPDSVKTIGDHAFAECKNLKSINLPDSITTVKQCAFSGCSSITTINIPKGLDSLSTSMFSGCTSLTTITIPDNIKSIGSSTFSGCSKLKSVAIPNTISKIGSSAFSNCSVLESIVIPNDVVEIGGGAFYGCKTLKEINLPPNITEINSETFYNCTSLSSIQIPNGVKTIGLSAFKNCSSLTDIILPEGLTKIRDSAFYECRNLYKINIPASVVTMEDNAFIMCYNLQEVYITDLSAWVNIDFETSDANPLHYGDAKLYINNTLVSELCIPNSVEKIGDYAFSSCTGFNNVIIPTSIKEIGVGAFAYNPLLDIYYDDTSAEWGKINIGTGNSSIDSAVIHCTDTSIGYAPESDFSAVNGAIIDYLGTASIVRVPEEIGGSPVTTIADSAFYGNSITQITLPEGVTSIGNSAFYNCKKLTYIRIPDTVKSIGNSAFYYCEALTSIALPDSVERIGTSLFRNCYDLQKVSLSSNITSIPEYAFYYCESLENINIPSKITSIGNYAFSSCSKIKGIAFPDSMTRIGSSAFSFCSELNTVDFSDNISAIGSDAFRGCTAITEIELPTALKNVASMSFYGCSNLKSITIPSRVTYIDSSAFYNCYSLEKIEIGHRLSSIYSNAFYGCYGLKTIDYACGEEDWNNLYVSSTGNECLSNATVNYKNTYLVDYNLNSGTGEATYSIAKLGESITITDLIPYREQYEFLGWSTSTSSSTDILYNAGDSYTGTANTTLYAIWRRIPIVLYSGTCGDNLTWTLDDEKNLIISGIGEMDSYSYIDNPAPWENYNSKIEKIIIDNGVESIGSCAFYGLTCYRDVRISPTIKRIESKAFGHSSYSSYVSSLHIYDMAAWCNLELVSDSWTYNAAFLSGDFYCNDELVTELVVPDSVTHINDYVFKFIDLDSVVLHENVTSIGEGAFKGSWIKTINLPSKLTHIGNYAFQSNYLETIELPYGITSIGDYTFNISPNLVNISIPDSVTSIGDSAFEDCDMLQSITLPNTVAKIGKSAFYGCSSLESINIPSSLTTISQYMYAYTPIKKIHIPLNITKIEENAFAYCTSLTDVYYEGSVNLWNKITIGSWNNYLTNASFTFGNLDILQIIYNYNCEEPNYEQTVSPNTSVTISAPIPTRTNYKFLGWAKSANASKPDYKTGDSVSIATEDVTLYAVWQRVVVTNTSVISNIIMVTPTNAQIGDCIIAACYMDGRMVYMDTYLYNGETTIPFIPNVKYDTIKIMVWESLSNLKPLSEVEEL